MKLSEFTDGEQLEQQLLDVFKEAKYPQTLKEIQKELGIRIQQRQLKDLINNLEDKGYDIKTILEKRKSYYSLVRFANHSTENYYRILGKLKTPFIHTSDWHIGCFPEGELIGLGEPVEKVYNFIHGFDNKECKQVFIKDTSIRKIGYNEKIIKIKPMSIKPIRVTGNHPILYAPALGVDSKGIKVIPTEDNFEYVRADELKEDGWVVLPRIKEVNSSIDKEMAFFYGFYLGDGYTSKTEASPDNTIGLCFNESEVDLIEKIEDIIIRRFDRKPCRVKQKGCIQVIFNHKELMKQLDINFKKGARNKKIPYFMFYETEENIISFLEGYCAADGWVRHRHHDVEYVYSTTSNIIAYQLPLLYAKIGLLPNVQYIPFKESDCNAGFHGDSYNISVSINPKRKRYKVFEEYILVPITSIEIESEKYNGYVYNFETDTNNYIAPIVVHNSKGWTPQPFDHMCNLMDDNKNLKDVVITGDILQGLGVHRLEAGDLRMFTIDEQVDYAIDVLKELPSKANVHLIMGNHEEKIKNKHQVGYDSLKTIALATNQNYYGHIAKLQLNKDYNVLLMHGGGGMSYATSYQLDKLWDKLIEKPNIVMKGHLHCFSETTKQPGCTVLQTGSFQRENSWLLNKGITTEVGYQVIWDYTPEEYTKTIYRPRVY